MKLYYSRGACSLSVRIIIHELGLENVEYEAVNLKTKKTESDADYFKVNPKGSVPALITNDNELLTENIAIQEYLVDTTKNTSLLAPIGDMKRYQTLSWLSYVSSDVHKSFGALFNTAIPQELKDSIFIPLMVKKLEQLETRLNQGRFLMGDEFTLPDAYLFVVLRWAMHFKIDFSNMSKLLAYFENLKQRESVRVSMQEEGLL